MKIYVSREVAGKKIFGGIGTHIYHVSRRATGYKNIITSSISVSQMMCQESVLVSFPSEGFKGVGEQRRLANIFYIVKYRLLVAMYLFKLSKREKLQVEVPEYMFELIFITILPKILRRNIEIITRLHGCTAYDRTKNEIVAKTFGDKIIWFLEKLQIENSDRVVAPTNFTRNLYRRYLDAEVHVLANEFVFVPGKTKKSGSYTITYIGSADNEKGIDIYMALIMNYPNLKFESFGSALCIEDNYQNKIVPIYEIPNELRNKRRVFIVPSKSETFGYTFIEGFHYTEIVIAADIEAFREIFDIYKPDNVMFVDRNNTNEWIKSVGDIVGV